MTRWCVVGLYVALTYSRPDAPLYAPPVPVQSMVPPSSPFSPGVRTILPAQWVWAVSTPLTDQSPTGLTAAEGTMRSSSWWMAKRVVRRVAGIGRLRDLG